MAFANPAIDPPRLPSPTKQSLHPRSPSRSPVRQYNHRDHDPLLRDLSPSTTLRAFRNDVRAQGELGKSLENASPAQRALGAKAARACLDLRSWAREVEGWEWPGSFEVPEPARKKQRMSSMSLGSLASRPSVVRSDTQESEDVEDEYEYCGSMPVAAVRRYEQRLDDIGRGLDELDVEELKDFVLSAHSQASFGGADIDDSIGAIGADTNLRHLDDFTALITATILSALPHLSRLTRLLTTWHIRLLILQATPSYLRDLRQARTDLDHGWAALAVSNHPAAADALKRSNASFTRETMMDMKDVISTQVNSLAKRLDAFLNELDGRLEVVPDRWIDEFEELEQQYGSWVVQAERKVIEGEWAAAQEAAEASPEQFVDQSNVEMPRYISTTTMVGPTITTATTLGSGVRSSMNTSTHTTSSGPMTTIVTTTSSPPRRGQEQRGREPSPNRDRPRHIPIVVDSYVSNPDQPTPMAELPTTTSVMATTRSISPFPRSNTPKSMDSTSSANVRKRAAFLNGEIENDGLIKSKPAPIVRPFERASNAFTRLFKGDGSKGDEESAAGATINRKGSKDAGLVASTGSKGMSSSSSLKGMLGMDKKDDKRSSRGSKISGTSSAGSKKAASSTGRPSTERMQYGDMVRPPGTPSSEGGRSKRSSKKSPGKTKDRGVMQYGDMMPMPDFERQEIERLSRGSTLSKDSRPKSSGRSRRTYDYGDVAAAYSLPRSKSLDRVSAATEQRPGTAKQKHLERALEYGDMDIPPRPSTGITNLSGSQSATKYQPDYLAPATNQSDATKRTSRQNITALPQLQTSDAKEEPQTYRPSGLSSPFHSPVDPDMPEDWPLSNVASPRNTPSPVKEGEPETAAVPADRERDYQGSAADSSMRSEPTFAADAFDRQFVHTIPAEPIKRPVSRDRGPEEMQFYFEDSTRPRTSGEVIPRDDSDDEEENDGAILWTSKSGGDRSWMRTGRNSTSRILDFQEPPPRSPARTRAQPTALPNSLPRPVSVVEEAEEEDLSSADDSEEEYGIKRRSDNAAGYFGGTTTSQSKSAANTALTSRSIPPVSPRYLKLRTPTTEKSATVAAARPEELIRRASTASVESHPRSELKSVEIVRRNSVGSPRASAPSTPLEPRRESIEVGADTVQTPTSPLQYEGGIVFPSPPSVPPRASSLRSSPEADRKAKDTGDLSVPKRKQGSGRREMLSKKDLQPGEDNFDRHVSEVLDRVHAPIKFRTRPGAETPNPLSRASAAMAARLPKAGERKNMTLAPAEISPRKATPADPEVKLYHLTQAGRAEPIKLYVRLVGEGERVMVRVGGGWADLADYLRQYAEHHGSRTVSEGTLELQTASAAAGNGTGASAAKRTFSGPPSALSEPRSASRKSPITPLSAFPPLERPRTKDSEKSWLGKEQPDFSMGDSDTSEPTSPSVQYARSDIAPPRRSSLLSSSRPSTAQSIRPSDASLEATGSSPVTATFPGGPGGGLSLAGPSKLKAELPEQKARWVEGMIQQVNKSASAEKSKEERERYVAEMGKVGGVRRVAFRSSSGAQ